MELFQQEQCDVMLRQRQMSFDVMWCHVNEESAKTGHKKPEMSSAKKQETESAVKLEAPNVKLVDKDRH